MMRCVVVFLGSVLLSSCFSIEPSSGWNGYQTDPRFSLGIPFQTVDPTTGSTMIIPGSTYRAQNALAPLRRATHR